MNPSSPVLAPLASLANARRRHSRGIAIAGILAATLAVAGFLALMDTWLEWRPPVRIALFTLLAATAIVVLIKRLRLAKNHDSLEAARLIEAENPEIGQKLRTALEISEQAPNAGNPDAAFFTDRLMRETGKELTLTPWSRLVPTKELWTRRATALAAFAVIAIVAVMWGDFRHALKRLALPFKNLTYTDVEWHSLPKGFDETHPPRLEFEVTGRTAQPELLVRQGGGDWKPVELTRRTDGKTWDIVFTGKTTDIQVKVLAGDATVEEKTIAYRPVPKLIESKATIAYPEYTGLKSETTPGGDVRTVEGSTATWNFAFNTPPDRITWTVAGAESVTLSPQSGTAKFSVSSEVKVGKVQGELAIFHADGERIDGWRFEIDGVIDKLPVVEIVEPNKDLELISTAEMPIRIRAKDDFGVAEIGLILDAGGERQWIVETTYDAKNERQVSELAAMMLDKIPLKITDNVRIHAYALDHKPRGGPRAVSPLRSVDIKQFQMRWYNGGEGGQQEELPDSEAVSDALMKLDKIIAAQRGILSDVFGTKESYRAKLPVEAIQKTMENAASEQDLAGETQRVAMAWASAGQIPADDVALIGTAAEQMAEAAGFLETPDLTKGFATGDRALSTLLQLRKEMVKILCKCKNPDEPKDPPPPPLTELAKEARRIAGEEHDVAGQIAPDAIAANNIDATRRQQEVALADTGELYAKLVDHHERTDGAMRLMDDSEKAVAKADKAINTETPAAAAPDLATAERDLLDLATFLEAMDLQKLSDTLRKLADNAEKAAGEQQKPGESEGKKPGEGEGEGEGEKGQAAAEAAKDTELAKKILEELAKKAGAGQEDPEAPKTPVAAAIEALQKSTDPAALAKELEKLAGMQKEGANQDAESLKAEATKGLGALAREYRDAASNLDASLLAELSKAREQAEALKKALAEKGKGEGNKPGENGKGPGEGKKPGEDGKGAVAAKEGQGEGEGEKPGEKGKGKGEGDKPGEGGKGEMASKDGKGQGQGPGDKPGKEDQGSGNEPGKNGVALGRFADTLERLRDEGGVGRMVMPLRAAPFSRSTIPLVEAADQRLQELIDRIPTDAGIASARGKLPEQSRREIEDYFRDLSDDFGGEVWETKQ